MYKCYNVFLEQRATSKRNNSMQQLSCDGAYPRLLTTLLNLSNQQHPHNHNHLSKWELLEESRSKVVNTKLEGGV